MVLVFLLGGAAAAREPQLTRAPQVLQKAEADYPAEAMAKHIQGEVQFLVDLDEAGEITRLQVTQSPDRSLTEAALGALFRMRFAPAEIDNRPAAVRIAYTYQFKLPETPLPEKPPQVMGTVQDEAGQPAPNITVKVEPQTLLTRTKADGRFTFTLPAPGVYFIAVSGGGIASSTLRVEAHADETLTLKITVHKAAPPSEYETTVRAAATNYEISRQQLSRDELRAVPGAFGDPLRVLEALPGLGRSPYASGILVMRGSSPDDSAVYMDGHPLPILYHFGAGPSIVPPEAIGALDLEPGSLPVRFGRATAGVVEIETRPGHSDAYHVGAHVSILDAGATADGPIFDRGSFRVAARRSYIEVVLPWFTKVLGGNLDFTLIPRYWDYFARVDFNVTPRLKLMLTGHGSDDALDFGEAFPPFSLPSNFEVHTSIHRINPRMIYSISDAITLDISPIVYWLLEDGETPYAFSDLATFAQGVRAELQTHLGNHQRFTMGVDWRRDDDVFQVQVPNPVSSRNYPSPVGVQSLSSNVTGHMVITQTGVYSEAQLLLGKLRMIPGVRMEHAEFLDRAETNVDPRLGARYEISQSVTAKTALGIYHRLPLPDQIAILTGQPQLGFERSWQATIGAEWNIDTAFFLDVQTYYKYMDNLTIGSTNDYATLGGPQPQRYVGTGEGQATGLEILLRRKLQDGIMGWISYSLSVSQRRDDNSQQWQLYTRDQTHNLNVLLSVELPWRIHASGRFRYVTGYPVRPVNGAIFDADANNYIPNVGANFTERLPSFIQLDMRVDREFGDVNGFNALVYIDVQNVTNAQNAEYYSYSNDYSQRYAYPGLPILPSIGVEARF